LKEKLGAKEQKVDPGECGYNEVKRNAEEREAWRAITCRLST